MNLASLNQKFHRPDIGLLVLRLWFGGVISLFGIQKLMGGQDELKTVGAAMGVFGITFAPVLWGLLAALVETLGGVCLILGIFFRPAALMLIFSMSVATASLWNGGPRFDSLNGLVGWLGATGLPLAFLLVFVGLLFTGPGRFSCQK